MEIGGRSIGRPQACLIIAEAGVNHNGDPLLAHALIDAAAAAGADVIKFQTFSADELVTPHAPKAAYQLGTTTLGETQREMLARLELRDDALGDLTSHCARAGILFLSTPYDRVSVDRLDDLKVSAYKISSTDATNLPFLKHVASKGRPIILSTGMCDLKDVDRAVRVLREARIEDIALLHCTSEYPAPLGEVNLRALATMERAFDCPIGYSDHTEGVGAAPWAVAAGACIIEKHFTLSRGLSGPDHAASLEPHEFAELVRTVRQVEAAMGDGVKRPTASEARNRPLLQRSVVARRAIAPGELIVAAMLTCKRPADGLPPSMWDAIVGRRAARAIAADEPLTHDAVAWD